jgi:phosphatidylglycerophosphate synthase
MYPIKAATVFLAIVSVALAFRQRSGARDTLAPADWVTGVRALIVALVAGLVGEAGGMRIVAAATAGGATAAALDGVDGWLARRAGAPTAFGARFDMEVDALLILVLSILCWQFGKAGAWVLASGLMRYGFVAAGAVWPWMMRPLPPSVRRKAMCVVQVVGLIVALAPVIPPPLSGWTAGLALTALSYSFLVDTLWLYRHAGA